MNDIPVTELTTIYLNKRAELTRFFRARTGSAAAAEDLLQDLYIKVRQVDASEVQNPTAYLYRLGLNLLLDKYRSETRQRRRDRDYVEAHIGGGGIGVSAEPSVEDAVDARLRLERLLKAVEQLPPQCKRVFRMHKLEGMGHQEIAKALGISRSAVEKHMITALKHLSAAMP